MGFKFSWYVRELIFIIFNSTNWRTRFSLIKHTFLYHFYNALTNKRSNGPRFFADVRVGDNQSVNLALRANSGDIFSLYETLMEQTYFIPQEYVRPDDVQYILDCGGNVGITALYFAERYPNAKIFSIEAHPDNYPILKRNVAGNKRIVPIHAALVGHPRDNVYFSTSKPTLLNKISDKKDDYKVRALTVDQLCQDYEITKIDIMKVDIEGGEKEIFENADFAKKVGFIIMELHAPYKMEKFREDLNKYGFSIFPENSRKGIKMITADRT